MFVCSKLEVKRLHIASRKFTCLVVCDSEGLAKLFKVLKNSDTNVVFKDTIKSILIKNLPIYAKGVCVCVCVYSILCHSFIYIRQGGKSLSSRFDFIRAVQHSSALYLHVNHCDHIDFSGSKVLVTAVVLLNEI